MNFWGVYKLTVGVLAAVESVAGMLRSINPPETSIWGALTLAAALLLAIDGLTDLLAHMHGWMFVAVTAAVPVGLSFVTDDWPPRLWMFAVVVGFAEWVFLGLKKATARADIGALACCAVLTISLANTTVMVFRTYWDEPQFWPLGQIFRFMMPIALPWTLILVLLVHSTRELKAPGSERGEEPVLASRAGDD
ncbi:MAG: hypothetical protein JST28_22990 [Acidobacteria bacterium]|nr:hypothetical protein [Acidobacteriota bacterium]